MKTYYPQVQKLLYVVLITKWKLRQSFELHPITVVMASPLGEVTRNLNISRRIAKCDLEVMGYRIYTLRTTIKTQVLADFVVECTKT